MGEHGRWGHEKAYTVVRVGEAVGGKERLSERPVQEGN